MSPTEMQLLAVHRTPAVPLADICDKYLSLSYREASRKAAMNALPLPAFRMTDSQRAPYMVRITHLAELIDRSTECAKASWDTSQT